MILITGITGKIGTELLPLLANSGEKFRLLARDPAKVKAPGNAEVVKGDLSDAASVESAMKGATRVFLVLGSFPGSTKMHNSAIDAAKKAGVKHLVRLSVNGADLKSPVTLARWHAESDAHLEKSGLPFTLLQPGSFMQNFLSSATSIRKEGAFYGAAGEGKVPFIDARDIASVALKVLSSSTHEGKKYVLTGGEALSHAQVADKFARLTGKPVKYVNLTPDQFKGGLMTAGLPGWLADDYVTMQAGIASHTMSQVSPVVATLLGKARSFDDFLNAHAAAFRG
jgi:uncharacterized protein YbjT (DUF2867 family)